MNMFRIRHLYLASFVMLLALASAPVALAATPEFQTVPVDMVFIDENATGQCGFPVQAHISGTMKLSKHDLQNGTAIEIERALDWTITFTNMDTGVSYTSVNAGPGVIIIQPDGTTRSAINGLVAIMTLPKEGLVLKNVGRLVFDENGNIIFQAGSAPLYTEGDVSGICMAVS